MNAESFAVPIPRPIYRLDEINQSLCYENTEQSSKCRNYPSVLY